MVNFRVACSHYRQQDKNACIGLSLTYDLEKETPNAYGVFEARFAEPNSLPFCLLLLYSRIHKAERIRIDSTLQGVIRGKLQGVLRRKVSDLSRAVQVFLLLGVPHEMYAYHFFYRARLGGTAHANSYFCPCSLWARDGGVQCHHVFLLSSHLVPLRYRHQKLSAFVELNVREEPTRWKGREARRFRQGSGSFFRKQEEEDRHQLRRFESRDLRTPRESIWRDGRIQQRYTCFYAWSQ